ncbi:MAG: hypothetical protein H6741_20440 [Alphaproteobacteria bacterium]|nr:hypothetical protein [Alphaproteobacteria bacterium]
MLHLALLQVALAGTPCADIEPPIPLEAAEAAALAELRALWVTLPEERLSRRQTDETLVSQLKAVMEARSAVTALAAGVDPAPEAQARAASLQALADAHVAEAVLRSPPP